MKYDLAPVVLFVYNRPWHTRQTLEALEKNELSSKSMLYVYCDGPKENASQEDLIKIRKVRDIVKEKSWCGQVKIIERSKNMGLADSIISGVSEVINKHGKVIVLEDDIVTSSAFLNYLNDALEYYKDEERVMHISAYLPPIDNNLPDFFFFNQTSCWGWGTWQKKWSYFENDPKYLLSKIIHTKRIKEFNMENSYTFSSHLEANINGSLKTWAIKWHASVFIKNGLCLHPKKSYVRNIGFDNSGENCGNTELFDVKDLNTKKFKNPLSLKEHRPSRKAIIEFNRKNNSGTKKNVLLTKIKNLLGL